MEKHCLVLVDLQNDYFVGGLHPLHESERAVEKAALVLSACRDAGIPVIHVRHESILPGKKFFLPGTPGAEIHPAVSPRGREPVVVKHVVSSYTGTTLLRLLRTRKTETVVVCGMQTNVCAASLVRESVQKGFNVVLIGDALAAVNERIHSETLAELMKVAGTTRSAGEFVALIRDAAGVTGSAS